MYIYIYTYIHMYMYIIYFYAIKLTVNSKVVLPVSSLVYALAKTTLLPLFPLIANPTVNGAQSGIM